MIPQGKYRIIAFKDFVPDKLRFIILLITAIAFQFSNAVYLTSLMEIVGEKGLALEDIKMMAYSSFIGMTMIFPLLFRIKFRFTSRDILLSCAAVILIGNIINVYSANPFVLIVTSLFIGMFRMIGTFECLSSIQLVITPKRDFAIFFSFVYLIVLGTIQISGLLTAEISYLYSWQYMHIIIVILQLCVMITLYLLLRPIRMMKKIPLYQIDWLGMGLWTLAFLLINFIFEYGKRLDWFKDQYICLATIASSIILLIAVHRMFSIRRPFIMPEVFKYPNVKMALLLLVFLQIFLSSTNVFLNTYTAGILHFNILNNASLNWAVFVGVLIGAAASFYWLAIFRGGYKTIFFLGFLCFVVYHVILYFIFSPSLAIEVLYVPYAIRGMGYVSLYISITLYMQEQVPFPHFFAGLTVLGFVRTAFGGTIINSVCNTALQYIQKRNFTILSQGLDFVNPTSNYIYQNAFNKALAGGHSFEQSEIIAASQLYKNINMQSFLLSWKEICGDIILFGIVILAVILLAHYIKPSFHQFPKLKNIWKYLWGTSYRSEQISR